MAKRNTNFDFLNQVLASGGSELAPSDIDRLIAERVTEDQWLEFKAGSKGGHPPEPKTLREYVAAFANSDGGTLILGVTEPKDGIRTIDGLSPGKGASTLDWLSRALTPIAAYLHPPPRLVSLAHSQGEVAVIAVARSPMLVPVVDGGHLRYFLRIHDQTLNAPEYVVADLLSDRRRRPMIRVELLPTIKASLGEASLSLNPRLWNESLVWAPQPVLGLVGWAKAGTEDWQRTVARNLLQAIDLHPTTPPICLHSTHHRFHQQDALAPMENNWMRSTEIRLPLARSTYLWEAALYVAARDCPTIWYQVSIEYDVANPETVTLLSHSSDPVVPGERPRVSWRSM